MLAETHAAKMVLAGTCTAIFALGQTRVCLQIRVAKHVLEETNAAILACAKHILP